MKEPNASGEITVKVHLEPVSLQAPRAKKHVITRAVREALGRPTFFFYHDVELAIEWLLSEQRRYHSPHSPDVDNVIKPIQDALCGPEGVLINDVQVQSVRCHWIDCTSPSQEVTIWVKSLLADDWVPKKGLVFVRVSKRLCFPFETEVPGIRKRLDRLMTQVRMFEETLESTGDYNAAKRLLPWWMPFHTARLKGFRTLDPQDVIHRGRRRLHRARP